MRNSSVDPGRRARLADLLTELRLGIDLGEIRSPAAFRARLERDGTFAGDDPWVRRRCASAGLAWWLLTALG
ncbi:MAG TPA: hypothetical protein VFR72_06365 [Gemmatimonadales bacterium]|nr:hypothetical protein [Gemmatimonadales bacterium]